MEESIFFIVSSGELQPLSGLRGFNPFLSNLIEKLPIAFGTVFTWIIVVFMVLNMFMSLSALIRYDQRGKKIPASNFFERYLDTHYNDQKMKLIYPKAKKVH